MCKAILLLSFVKIHHMGQQCFRFVSTAAKNVLVFCYSLHGPLAWRPQMKSLAFIRHANISYEKDAASLSKTDVVDSNVKRDQLFLLYFVFLQNAGLPPTNELLNGLSYIRFKPPEIYWALGSCASSS